MGVRASSLRHPLTERTDNAMSEKKRKHGPAVVTECPLRTVAGTCRCTPKCKHCGWGPHMAVHLGTKGAPAVAFDHAYEPKDAP